MNAHTTDPLVEAIADGDLTGAQRAALADVVQALLLQVADGNIARPGTLMDRTVEDATRWNALTAAVRANRADLYPQAVAR